MNIDNLIERLKECGTYGFKRGICQEEAAEALCEIQIELQAMRGAANSYKAELEKVKGERDRLIARTKGECWTCIRRYECNSRRGPHKRCRELDEMLLKEE